MAQPHEETSAADRLVDVADPVSEARLAEVLADVPKGAFALCAIAVTITMLLWLAVYFGVFIPKGPVN